MRISPSPGQQPPFGASNGAIAHYVIYGSDEGRVAYSLDGAAIDLAIVIGS